MNHRLENLRKKEQKSQISESESGKTLVAKVVNFQKKKKMFPVAYIQYTYLCR